MAGRSPATTPGCFRDESSPILGDDTVSQTVPWGHRLPHQAWGSSLRGSTVRTPDPGHALGHVCMSGPAASAETSIGAEEGTSKALSWTQTLASSTFYLRCLLPLNPVPKMAGVGSGRPQHWDRPLSSVLMHLSPARPRSMGEWNREQVSSAVYSPACRTAAQDCFSHLG